jgi:uroporphyrinogen decarboxylase
MNCMLLDNPAPDFAGLEGVLRGAQVPRRVHLVELLIDDQVLRSIVEKHMGQTWVPWGGAQRWLPPPPDQAESYFRQLVNLYYRLGYDCVPISRLWLNHPLPRRRRTEDTAALSKGDRAWVNERRGLISSWGDFRAFPWDEIEGDGSPCEWVAKSLPPGMKVTVMANLFEHVLENLLGYEGLFYLRHDEPDLVSEVFARWGQKVYDYYASVVGLPQVGAIFHGDDLGFKTSTLLSRADLRRLVFPWLKKYAALAHEHGKMFWHHCCGNIYKGGVINDLIDDVRIDALHSFQDVILPVTEFKSHYGRRVAALGGVDMDKLARLDELSLRAYIRSILDTCVAGGRFAFGSGNSIANYVPLQNYAILLEESRCWQPAGNGRSSFST